MESFIVTISNLFAWIMGNYQLLISSLVAFLGVLISLALVIPGNQPEAFLQKIVDFLSKFSKK